MGGNSSRRQNKTPIPTYSPPGGSPGISRPGGAVGGVNAAGPLNPQGLAQLNQTVAALNNQVQALQRGGAVGGMPYGPYPMPGAMPYGAPPMVGQSPLGTPPFGNPYMYPPSPMFGGGSGPPAVYRDTDFGAIANIAGLNAADIALLHREFLNLTRGGQTKIDRGIFRQILRDVLLQANNEQVDRVIEQMFVTIDRNHDGFIDFPEFVGAFKEVLKEKSLDSSNYYPDDGAPDILSQQLRATGLAAGIDLQPLSYVQQMQPATQFVTAGGLSIVPLATAAVPQVPLMYGAAAPFQFSDATAPMLTLDQSQASYVIATPGQYLITQPTAIQCVPLPLM